MQPDPLQSHRPPIQYYLLICFHANSCVQGMYFWSSPRYFSFILHHAIRVSFQKARRSTQAPARGQVFETHHQFAWKGLLPIQRPGMPSLWCFWHVDNAKFPARLLGLCNWVSPFILLPVAVCFQACTVKPVYFPMAPRLRLDATGGGQPAEIHHSEALSSWSHLLETPNQCIFACPFLLNWCVVFTSDCTLAYFRSASPWCNLHVLHDKGLTYFPLWQVWCALDDMSCGKPQSFFP